MNKKSPQQKRYQGVWAVDPKSVPGLRNLASRMKRVGLKDQLVDEVAKAIKTNDYVDLQLAKIVANKIRYEESKHPRHAKGTPQGGKFKTKGVSAKGKSHGKVSKSKGV